MGFFDSPSATTSQGTSQASVTGAPDWYQQFLQQIAQAGVDYANTPYTPYTGAQVAGMAPGQQAAQTGVTNLVANGNPMLPAAQTDIQNGLSAVSTPAQTWNSTTASQYMSPYTSSVVDEIGRLGNQNFNENLMPAVQDAFIGSGGVGSTRNASILSQTARDSEANTLGQQENALNSGYTTASGIFNNDANRALQQQTTAGQLGVSGGSTLGSLGAGEEGTQLSGLNLLNTIGNQDQATNQNALTTAYNNFTTQRDWNLTNAADMNKLLQGMSLPTSTTQDVTQTQTTQAAGSSPAQALSSLGMTIGGVLSPPSNTTNNPATSNNLTSSQQQGLLNLIALLGGNSSS